MKNHYISVLKPYRYYIINGYKALRALKIIKTTMTLNSTKLGFNVVDTFNVDMINNHIPIWGDIELFPYLSAGIPVSRIRSRAWICAIFYCRNTVRIPTKTIKILTKTIKFVTSLDF